MCRLGAGAESDFQERQPSTPSHRKHHHWHHPHRPHGGSHGGSDDKEEEEQVDIQAHAKELFRYPGKDADEHEHEEAGR